MKAKWKIFTLALSLGLAFAGCGTVEWDDGSPSLPEREGETVAETLPAREETAMEPVVEGTYTLLGSGAPIPGGDASLADAFQAGDVMLLFWRGANGAALEAVNPATGESLYQTALGSGIYGVEPDGLTPGGYRIDGVGKVEYGSAAAKETTEGKELPMPVRDAIRRGYPAQLGAPYDLLRGGAIAGDRFAGESIAYAAEDGVYLAGWDGEEPAKLLDNASIPDWLGYWGLDARQYEADRLFYIAPRIMGGGSYLAATAYYSGESGARCLGVASVEVETNRISYFPDPVAAGEGPAERVNDDVLHARGESGDILITLSTGEAELIPSDGGGARYSFDYLHFARVKATEYSDGFHEFILLWEPVGQPESGSELLTLGGYARARVAAVTEGYILLEAEEPGGGVSVLAVTI